MKRTLTLGLVLLLSCAAGTTAFASSGTFKGRADVQSALTGLGVVATSAARLDKAHNGRIDLTFTSSTPLRDIIAKARIAYRRGVKLPSKYQLVGYAKLNRRGSWSLTFDRGGYYSVAEIRSSGSGTKVTLWGWTHKVGDRGASTHPRLPMVRR